MNSWQLNASTTQTDFFNFTGYLVNAYIGLAYCGLAWLFGKSKINAIKYITYVTFSSLSETFLKLVYAYPRPFMVFQNIQALHCSEDFGRPSGHGLNGFATYFFLFYMFINPWLDTIYSGTTESLNNSHQAINQTESHDKEENQQEGYDKEQNQQKKQENLIKSNKFFKLSYLGWLLCIAIIVGIGLGRIYLGVHSFDQVLLGWVYAFSYSIFIIYFFDEYFENFLKYLIVKPWANPIKPITMVLVPFMIIVIVPIIAYEIQKTLVIYDPVWISNLLIKCDSDVYQTPYVFLVPLNFTKCAVGMLNFGILFGLLIIKGEYFELEKLIFLSWYKEILRIIIYAGCIALPFFALSTISENINPYLTYFIIGGLRNFLVVFLIIVIPPYVFFHLNISKDGDLFRQKVKVKISISKEDLSI